MTATTIVLVLGSLAFGMYCVKRLLRTPFNVTIYPELEDGGDDDQ